MTYLCLGPRGRVQPLIINSMHPRCAPNRDAPRRRWRRPPLQSLLRGQHYRQSPRTERRRQHLLRRLEAGPELRRYKAEAHLTADIRNWAGVDSIARIRYRRELVLSIRGRLQRALQPSAQVERVGTFDIPLCSRVNLSARSVCAFSQTGGDRGRWFLISCHRRRPSSSRVTSRATVIAT
jgi:hypothetical protein